MMLLLLRQAHRCRQPVKLPCCGDFTNFFVLLPFCFETAQMMIMNPLSGGGLRGLFSTHPATEERIARLRALR